MESPREPGEDDEDEGNGWGEVPEGWPKPDPDEESFEEYFSRVREWVGHHSKDWQAAWWEKWRDVWEDISPHGQASGG